MQTKNNMKKTKVILQFVDHRLTLADLSDAIALDSDVEQCNVFVILDMNPENEHIHVIIRKFFDEAPWYKDHYGNELLTADKIGLSLDELNLVCIEIEKYGFVVNKISTTIGALEYSYVAVPSVKHVYANSPKCALKDFLFITEIVNDLEQRDQLNGSKSSTMTKDWRDELQQRCKVQDHHVRALHAEISGKANW